MEGDRKTLVRATAVLVYMCWLLHHLPLSLFLPPSLPQFEIPTGLVELILEEVVCACVCLCVRE